MSSKEKTGFAMILVGGFLLLNSDAVVADLISSMTMLAGSWMVAYGGKDE